MARRRRWPTGAGGPLNPSCSAATPDNTADAAVASSARPAALPPIRPPPPSRKTRFAAAAMVSGVGDNDTGDLQLAQSRVDFLFLGQVERRLPVIQKARRDHRTELLWGSDMLMALVEASGSARTSYWV